MTTILDLDAFLMCTLEQRAKRGNGKVGPLRSAAVAVDLATRCGAKIITGPYFCPSYSPGDDLIRIPTPPRRLLKRPKVLAWQVLHELTHWSGVPARLNRPQAQKQWDAIYNREELVAEIGAVLLSFDLGITTRPLLQNHQYLASFLATIDRPDVAMHVALSLAQQAAAYLHALAGQPHDNAQLGRAGTEPHYGVSSYL